MLRWVVASVMVGCRKCNGELSQVLWCVVASVMVGCRKAYDGLSQKFNAR